MYLFTNQVYLFALLVFLKIAEYSNVIYSL